MPVLQLIFILVIIGLVLWLVNTFIPMEPRIKNILNVVVIICVVLWLLSVFLGVNWGSFGDIRVGHPR